MPITYFLYARKSTEDEDRQVMSIEAQLAELHEFAKRENIIIAKTFIESKSAKKPGREVFNKMMQEVEQGTGSIGLLAWHPDRLARNSVDGGKIIYAIDTENIASLRFPTFWFEPTPQGLFMLQVAFGQSKYYSDNLSENVKRGIRQKIRRGEWLNKAPFGYVNNKEKRNIEPHPFKARIVTKLFKEFAVGNHTLQSASELLSLWGIMSRKATPLSKSAVYTILTNTVYLGMIKCVGETYEGIFSPLIERTTFDTVQKLLKNKARPRKKKQGHNFAFCGLFTCGECTAAITAQYAHGHGGTYCYYRCTKRLGPCSQKYIQEKNIIAQIKERLQTIAISDEWFEAGLKQIGDWEKESKNNTTAFFQNLETHSQEIDGKLNKLVDAYLDGIVDKAIYLTKKEELIKQKTDFTQKKSVFAEKGISWIEPFREFWKDANLAKKLILSNDFGEIKSFVAKNGTNPHLLQKTVSWNWSGAFQILHRYAQILPPTFSNPNCNEIATSEISKCRVMSG